MFYPDAELCELVHHVIIKAGKVDKVASGSPHSPAMNAVKLAALITSSGLKATLRIPDPDLSVLAPARHACAVWRK